MLRCRIHLGDVGVERCGGLGLLTLLACLSSGLVGVVGLATMLRGELLTLELVGLTAEGIGGTLVRVLRVEGVLAREVLTHGSLRSEFLASESLGSRHIGRGRGTCLGSLRGLLGRGVELNQRGALNGVG